MQSLSRATPTAGSAPRRAVAPAVRTTTTSSGRRRTTSDNAAAAARRPHRAVVAAASAASDNAAAARRPHRAVVAAPTAARRPRRALIAAAASAASDEDAATAAAAAAGPAFDAPEEVLFLETNGAPASLAFNLLMAGTIIYIPLSIAALGRAAWINIRFTNKRVEIVNTSPLFKGTQQVAYSQIKEVRSAPRAFDLWGDVVLFLKGGGTVELTGLPRHREIVAHVRARCDEARRAELEQKLREAGEAAPGSSAAAAVAAMGDE